MLAVFSPVGFKTDNYFNEAAAVRVMLKLVSRVLLFRVVQGGPRIERRLESII